PPRAWGTSVLVVLLVKLPRFTPTCVGNILRIPLNNPGNFGSPPRAWGTCYNGAPHPRRIPVHPHVRGEHACADCGMCRYSRFTPTCVGTIGEYGQRYAPHAVHPHVRGEHGGLDGR